MLLLIRNCKQCGKVFLSSGSLLCPECFEAQEKQFHIVKEYLLENKGTPATKVSKETGVPVEVVAEFVRRGHLVGVNLEKDDSSKCAICKKPVSAGRICPDCRRALMESKIGGVGGLNLSSEPPRVSAQKEQPKAGGQMYTMDLIRKRRR